MRTPWRLLPKEVREFRSQKMREAHWSRSTQKRTQTIKKMRKGLQKAIFEGRWNPTANLKHRKENLNNPFRPNSIRGRAFTMLVSGCSFFELINFLGSSYVSIPTALRALRRGHKGRFTWEFQEANGQVKITNVQT